MEAKVTHNIVDDKSSLPPKLVKILHASMKHYDFEYKLELNTDHIHFDPSGFCKPGGLCFTDLDNFYKFLEHGTLIADVKVPKGVEIYDEPNKDNSQPYKWKASSIIISNIRKVSDLPQWNDLSFWLSAVQKDVHTLRFVPYELKTTELCLAAVQRCGGALQYVPEELKTAEMCLAASNRFSTI